MYVNGEFRTKNEATVSVYDHGLLYGDGIFEGIRVYKERIFKCEQHMDRLWRSAKALRLKIPVSREEMIAIQRRCIEINGIVDGYIRLVVTRGVGTLGLNPFACPEAGIICIADQIALYPPEMYSKGMTVCIAERPRLPIRCLDPRVKSLNYLNNIMAKVESLDRGLLEAIMLNTDGYVSECTGDNIFAVKDGVIFTPPGDAGILEGITRQFIMDTVAPACGYRVEERMIKPIELIKADEVFLTGSAAEMIAVTAIIAQDPAGHDFEHVIGTDKTVKAEGKMTREMRAKFREIVTGDDVPED
ncbi:MAG: branched-chain-amino-acid transaminase [Phycisphaerales bacterium]|nr:branched-chain-amino-acid transaminase [Phycisphaerales bacterium]